MKAIFSSFTQFSSTWDFSDGQSNGGAFSLNLGLVIPKNSIINNFFIRTWIDPVETLPGGTFSFDLIEGAIVTTGFFAVAQPIVNFNILNPVLPGFNFITSPQLSTSDDNGCGIMITYLPGGLITSGLLQIFCTFSQSDQLI
jgi:hypothetical protein